MKHISVCFNFGVGNVPEFFADIPDEVFAKIHHSFRYEMYPDNYMDFKGRYYVAQHESGLINFFRESFDNHRGYGGRAFNLNMTHGTTIQLIGPWSSNSESVEKGTGVKSYPCCIRTKDITEQQHLYSSHIKIPIPYIEMRDRLEAIKKKHDVKYDDRANAINDMEAFEKDADEETKQIVQHIDYVLARWIDGKVGEL